MGSEELSCLMFEIVAEHYPDSPKSPLFGLGVVVVGCDDVNTQTEDSKYNDDKDYRVHLWRLKLTALGAVPLSPVHQTLDDLEAHFIEFLSSEEGRPIPFGCLLPPPHGVFHFSLPVESSQVSHDEKDYQKEKQHRKYIVEIHSARHSNEIERNFSEALAPSMPSTGESLFSCSWWTTS